MAQINIIYHSVRGHTERVAESIGEGVERVAGCSCRLITVEDAGKSHVLQCEGLILGSPTHMGNISAEMKTFIDHIISPIWMEGGIPGTVGTAFTSSGSMHGDKEFAILAMLMTMFQLGMTLVSLPPGCIPENKSLGYSHGVGTSVLGRQPNMLPNDDITVASQMGKRVAEVAYALHG